VKRVYACKAPIGDIIEFYNISPKL